MQVRTLGSHERGCCISPSVGRRRSISCVLVPKSLLVATRSWARYDDALRVSEELLITTNRYRLDFAIPYALASAATASAGLRKWRQAERYAAEALALSHESRDVAAQQHVFGKYLRVLAQQRRHRTGLTIPEPSLKGALPGIHAEILLCRALILASVGRVEEARRMTVELVDSTAAVEATVLGSAVSAISALKLSEPDALQRVAELEEVRSNWGPGYARHRIPIDT